MPRISFDVTDQTYTEAQQIAAEMGLTIEEIAQSAFEGYLDGVRTVRENDLDEADPAAGESETNVTQLEHAGHRDDAAELEGTEPWLSTEPDPDGSDR